MNTNKSTPISRFCVKVPDRTHALLGYSGGYPELSLEEHYRILQFQ